MPADPLPAFDVDVHLTPDHLARALAADVRAGLTATPKSLPPKWFYDERGSQLFDEITRLPEYYPTRREKEILTERAVDIAACGADTLIELGSGTSEKTRWLLDALQAAGTLRRYVPFDVDEVTLARAGHAVAAEYPGIDVHGVCGDFEHHLPFLPRGGRRLIAMLGGTIGNLNPLQRKDFFADLGAGLDAGDALLLGTDLVKDTARLVAAYDDSAGVTAAFNRNVLRVINRSLDADFDPDGYDHLARFDLDEEWIEMHLVARAATTVRIAQLDLTVDFAAGEQMRTEISAKFRRERLEAELAEAGLRLSQWWTDRNGDYALSLAVPS
jgi:L-histidine N-alpha-methyltransferase